MTDYIGEWGDGSIAEKIAAFANANGQGYFDRDWPADLATALDEAETIEEDSYGFGLGYVEVLRFTDGSELSIDYPDDDFAVYKVR